MAPTRSPVNNLKDTISVDTNHCVKNHCVKNHCVKNHCVKAIRSLPGHVAYHKRLSVHLNVPAVSPFVTGFSTLGLPFFC
jgi:hypothetical protein